MSVRSWARPPKGVTVTHIALVDADPDKRYYLASKTRNINGKVYRIHYHRTDRARAVYTLLDPPPPLDEQTTAAEQEKIWTPLPLPREKQDVEGQDGAELPKASPEPKAEPKVPASCTPS